MTKKGTLRKPAVLILAAVMTFSMGASTLAFADDAAPAAAAVPTLAASATKGASADVSLTLRDATDDWMNKVTEVSVDGQTLTKRADGAADTSGTYVITKTVSGENATYRLVIDGDVFSKTPKRTQNYTIVIKSEGYADLSTTVTINNYGAETLYVRHLDADGKVLSTKTYTMTDLENMADVKDTLYQSICSHSFVRSFHVTGVTLDTLLKDAGLNAAFKSGTEIRIRTNDTNENSVTNDDVNDTNAYYPEGAFSYDYLMQKRYKFPDIYTNETLKQTLLDDANTKTTIGDSTANNYLGAKIRKDLGSSTKEEVAPMIALQWSELTYRSNQSEPSNDYQKTKENMAFRLFYGIGMDANDASSVAKDETSMRISYDVYGIDIVDTDKDNIDRSALEKAVQSASELKEADYTADSWTAFKTAYDTAKRLVYIEGINQNVGSHFRTNQDYLNEQLKNLTDAEAALVKVTPDTPVTPDKPDQPDTPVTPDKPDQPDTPVTPDTPDQPTIKKPAKTSIKSLKSTAKKTAVITWKKVTKNNSGYKIRYSVKSNMKNAKTVTVKNVKTVKKTIKKLRSGKKYYFQVRTYGAGGNSAWSAKKSVKVK